MSAPFRITRPARRAVARSRDSEEFKGYLDRLTKMIPSEVIGLYLVGSGFIPNEDRITIVIWSVICVVAVVCSRVYGTTDPQKNLSPQWTSILISTISFVIWLYTLGGPFAVFDVHIPYIGSLMVLAWTFFVPLFYKGSFE